MAYIDLNPVRADIFNTPESSSYTSFRKWLESRFALQQAIDDQTETGCLFDFKTRETPWDRHSRAYHMAFLKIEAKPYITPVFMAG